MSKPIVAIVGRPNVGKSTLFNQIGKRRISIVDDMPGVTRDRIYADAEWLGRAFTMVDTGGIEFEEETFLTPIREQARIAIDEADVIVFVVDGRAGVTSTDEEVARMLRTAKKPVVLAVNKIDSPTMRTRMPIRTRYGLPSSVVRTSASPRWSTRSSARNGSSSAIFRALRGTPSTPTSRRTARSTR